MYIKQINENYKDYCFYNLIEHTYFGMLSYIMLNLIINKPKQLIPPVDPVKHRKKTARISARQVQNNLDAFIKEQRQFNEEQREVNKVLLEFVAETRQFIFEQREFNKMVLTRFDKLDARIDNLVVKNKLVE